MAIKTTTRCFTVLLTLLSSEVVMAAEKSTSSVTYWPLIALAVILVVFRKQFISAATPELHDVEHQHAEDTKKVEPTKKEAKPVPAKVKPVKKVTKAKTTKKTSSNIIDLTDDSNQCQASTSKGTRCKRTSSLETTKIKVADKTYQLTVCKQHNTKSLKPFSELIN